jgi:hypothetical protein
VGRPRVRQELPDRWYRLAPLRRGDRRRL